MPANPIALDGIAKSATALHDAYLPFRNTQVPFPAESVAFWCHVLALQKHDEVQGDFLELGVEHGGTAFLSIQACEGTETQFLVDLTRSPRFDERWVELPVKQQDQVSFREMSTQNPETDDLTKRHYRFMHIDAGHTYDAVARDMRRYAGLLQPMGVLCCDDFFTNRWPDVTLAILDTYRESGILPVALVNRKAYFARAEDAQAIRARLRDTKAELEVFGPVKHWEVHINKEPLEYFQITVQHAVGRSALS